jgi:hypothetical protein
MIKSQIFKFCETHGHYGIMCAYAMAGPKKSRKSQSIWWDGWDPPFCRRSRLPGWHAAHRSEALFRLHRRSAGRCPVMNGGQRLLCRCRRIGSHDESGVDRHLCQHGGDGAPDQFREPGRFGYTCARPVDRGSRSANAPSRCFSTRIHLCRAARGTRSRSGAGRCL